MPHPDSSTHFLLCRLVVQVAEDGQSNEIAWSNSNHWVEASITLLGSQGRMLATSPSIVARTPPTLMKLIADDGSELSTRRSSESASDEEGTDDQPIEAVLVRPPSLFIYPYE